MRRRPAAATCCATAAITARRPGTTPAWRMAAIALYGEWPQVAGIGFGTYAVSDGSGLLLTNTVRQDGSDGGYIGRVEVTDGTLSVTVSYPTTSYQIRADQLILQRLDDASTADDDDFHLQAGSPGVDRGDPGRFYLAEPGPNGARINVGAYGNTAEATQNPAEIVQVLSPNGLEKLIVGDSVQVDYRIAGLAQEDPAC